MRHLARTFLVILSAFCALVINVKAENVVVHPKPIPDHLRNPGMGLLYYGLGDIPDVADTLYVWVETWDLVQPEPGKFNWDLPQITNVIAACQKTGRQAGMRILPDFHPVNHPLPKWLRDAGVRLFPRQDENLKKGEMPSNYEPEYWHPAYIAAYEELVRGMAKRFDGEPWLAFIDMRFYGFWGEGHRYHAAFPWPKDVDKRKLIERYQNFFFKYFHKTPLTIETATDEKTPFPQGTAVDVAVAKGCWMRRDGFGPFISPGETRFIEDHWKHSLVVAENGLPYTSFLNLEVKKAWTPNSPVMTIDEVLDQMFEHHVNYYPLGWGAADYKALKEKRPDLIQKVSMEAGYRFEVAEAEWPKTPAAGSPLIVRTLWTNSAVGRLPFPRVPVLYLIDSNGLTVRKEKASDADPAQWFAGTNYPIVFSLKTPSHPGVYRVAVALEDTHGQADIALGMEGNDGGKRYVLGKIEIQ
jgi:hypothetical protein